MTRCKARVADWAAPSSGACVRGPDADRAGVSRTPPEHVAARGSGNPRPGIATWLHGGHICARAGGFTLLEVLLATGLAVTLLFGLWSLLGMQTRLYTAAPAQIEEGQLIRSLFLQLSDDLHNALHVPSVDPTKTTDFLVAEVSHGLTGGVVRAGSAVPLQGAATVAAAGSAAMVVPRSSGRPSALIGIQDQLHFTKKNPG